MTTNADVDNSIINLGELPHECFATGFDNNLYFKHDFYKIEFKICNGVMFKDKEGKTCVNFTFTPIIPDAPTPQQ